MSARMTFDEDRVSLFEDLPERLVIRGFRCWMAGYEYQDIQCWETAWREYSNAMPHHQARRALGGLQCWVRTIREVSARDITCYPHCCRHVCRDECLALLQIMSHQSQDRRAMRMAAHYLTGRRDTAGLDRVIEAGGDFSAELAEAGQTFSAVTLARIEAHVALEQINGAGGPATWQ